MIVVQAVLTTWSKASRGEPGASSRARIPLGFAFDLPPGDLPVVIDLRRAAEPTFEIGTKTETAVSFPVTVGGYEVLSKDGSVVVRRRSTSRPFRGEHECFRLRPDTWGRAASNRRITTETTWLYEKTVINAANLAHCSSWYRSMFASGVPDFVADELVDLY